MSERTVYARRLRSATVQQVCKCKVGSCSICGSKCRRCMCACDGIEPSEALARSRGGYRRQVTALAIKRKSNDEGTKTSEPPKKKKYNQHFKKPGVIRNAKESRLALRRRKQIEEEEKDDSDSDYVDKPLRPPRKRLPRKATDNSKSMDNKHDAADDDDVDENTLTTLSVNEDNSTVVASIVDDDEYVPSNDDFTLDIETIGCSIMDDDDDISLTIAQKIINSRPPPIKDSNKHTSSTTRKKPSNTTTTNENRKNVPTRRSMRGKKHILMSKRSELLSEVNEVVKRTHVSSRSSTLHELLKI